MSAGVQISAKLDRTDQSTPWGFRLQGGKDFSRPLTIQRVTPGSLADKCGLKAGDVVVKITGVDTTNIFHKEAQQAVIRSLNFLELTLQRGGAASYYGPESYSYPTFSEVAQPSNPYGSSSYNGPPSFNPTTSGLSSQIGSLSLNRSPKPFRAYKADAPSVQQQEPVTVNVEVAVDTSNSEVNPSSATRIVHEKYNSPIGLYSAESCTEKDNREISVMSPPEPSQVNAPLASKNTSSLHGDGAFSPPSGNFPYSSSDSASKVAQESVRNPVLRNSETLKLIRQGESQTSDDEKQEVTTHSRTFRILQQQLESGTYNPQEHPSRRLSPAPPKDDQNKSQSSFVLKQFNSPIGLYSSENASEVANFQRKSSDPMSMTDATNKYTTQETKPDGTKIYHPSETYKLVKESKESQKSYNKSPISDQSSPTSSPKMGRTMRHLQMQLDTNQEFKPVISQDVKYRAGDDDRTEKNNNYAAPQTISVVTAKPYVAPDVVSENVKIEPKIPQYMAAVGYEPYEPKNPTLDPMKAKETPGLNEPGRDYSHGLHQGGGGGPPSNYAPASRGPPSAPAPKWSPSSAPSYAPAAPSFNPNASAYNPSPAIVQGGAPAGGRPGNPKFGKKGDAVFKNEAVARIPVCNGCGAPIRGPFVSALGQSWCPDHFTCSNCGVKLIEIGFIEIEGRLYCERDYEQFFAPRCTKCKQTIIGDCVNALTQTWHPHCFLCTHCRQPIGSGGFHMEDSLPYCEKDWQEMFQMKCSGCQFPIEPGDRWVEAIGQNFHSECFNCSACQVNLEGQAFCAKNGKPYCKKHASGRI